MTAEEEMQILEKISREVIAKKRLLYSYEIKEILDQFIVKGEWIPLYQRTVGEWEYKCSNCGRRNIINQENLCPSCGAPMKGVKNETKNPREGMNFNDHLEELN